MLLELIVELRTKSSSMHDYVYMLICFPLKLILRDYALVINKDYT